MISFIVPAHNEEQLIGETLDALQTAAREAGTPYEIIVVDDASTDRTAAIAASLGARVVHVEHRQIARARNAGAAAAVGDVFVFVDADTRVDAAAIRASVAAVEHGAVGGGALLRFDEPQPVSVRVIGVCLRLTMRLSRLAGGAYVFATRDAFEAVGGFDETLFATEELTLSRALRRVGPFVILSESVVTSARKARTHTARELLAPIGLLFRRGPGARRQRTDLDLWYGPRRSDPGDLNDDMTFTRKILVGLAAGVAVGLFFGESANILKWAADGFVKLLQMTVLPYVTVSIVTSLGSLSYQQARTLGIRAGAVLVGLWMVALLYAFLIPLAFPDVESAMFFSSALLERRPGFNFVDLYVPSNPFNSLANNVVPAVVLFSVILGVALIGVERKQVLLDVLHTAADALSRATRFIVRLTPYGLFAIAATAAGTLSIEQLGRLQVYLISYVGVALLLSLWVLPGLVATLTPIRVREMFSLTRDSLITAFVAGDLFIVLPALVEASRTLIARHAPHLPEATDLPDVLVPASFNFPHTGKLLSISFILFAGWFADASVPVSAYPQLAFTGLLTFFGSLNAAVPFLLDLFRIPADTFQLFLATGVINSRVGTLVAAVHTLTVAVLGTCAITGMLRVHKARVLRYLAITTGLTVLVIGGARVLFDGYLRAEYSKDRVIGGMHLLRAPSPATVHRVPVAQDVTDTGPLLQSIRARGVLRVGYVADALPYAFFNSKGDLVGLDIDLAHRLASELGVSLEFMPIDREQLPAELARNCCDIVMAGMAVTTLRAAQVLFSATYLDETFAFVVPDHSRELFSSWDDIRGQAPLVIAVPNVPYYIDKLRERLPQAELRVLHHDIGRTFDEWPSDVAALAMPAERGSAWTLLHPEFSVVVPEPGIMKVPLAYPIGRHDASFAAFINTWIDLKRKDGTLQSLYDYWVQGRDASPRRPRWSIIRDVLHWTE